MSKTEQVKKVKLVKLAGKLYERLLLDIDNVTDIDSYRLDYVID